MSQCANCGTETFRIRTTFHTGPHGEYIGQTDACPSCAPGSFEPQWMREKLIPAYEAYPTKYRPVRQEDGGIEYVATDEWRADQEEKLMRPNPDDAAAQARAIQKRREWAKSRPRKLTQGQIDSINARKQEILESPICRVAGVRPNHG